MTADKNTWRDLADMLTVEQIAELEYCEREQIPPGLADAEHRLQLRPNDGAAQPYPTVVRRYRCTC